MKLKDYKQMMSYLTSTGEFSRNRGLSKKDAYKNKFIEHRQKVQDVINNQKDNKVTVMNRVKTKPREEDIIERAQRFHYLYDNGPKPKHMDNKNIKTFEEMQEMKKVKTPTKKIEPVKIDFTGINTSLNELENLKKTSPIKPTIRKKKSEGLAYLLGIDE